MNKKMAKSVVDEWCRAQEGNQVSKQPRQDYPHLGGFHSIEELVCVVEWVSGGRIEVGNRKGFSYESN